MTVRRNVQRCSYFYSEKSMKRSFRTAILCLFVLKELPATRAFQSIIPTTIRVQNTAAGSCSYFFAKGKDVESFSSSQIQSSSIELKKAAKEIQAKLSNNYIDWNEMRQLIHGILRINMSKSLTDPSNRIMHDLLRIVTQRAFSSSTWDGVKVGLELMEIQAGGNSDYNNKEIRGQIRHHPVPRSTAIHALKALNNLMKRKYQQNHQIIDRQHQANAAFRVLQRLCTGVGLSNGSIKRNSVDALPQVRITLDERDFSMVLNGFVNTGQMHMAHRVVALQQRTAHAPPLSPVAYSILIKGYGNLKDANGVDRVLEQARQNEVEPDIIMYNSLIDAYINCDNISKAKALFEELSGNDSKPKNATQKIGPKPNLRTYNTMLKGFVKSEDLESAIKMSEAMQKFSLWDAVTTNTLVGVAVAAQNFDLAETILRKHTMKLENISTLQTKQSKHHPNVEAYTELLDGYAKTGQLNKALQTLKIMRELGVYPNEITYTCIIGALAKHGKTAQAEKLMLFMRESDRIHPGVITYNSLFCGMLVERYKSAGGTLQHTFSQDVDHAQKILFDMMNIGVKPNAVTCTIFVDALGRCTPPRINEAKNLVEQLRRDCILSSGDAMVSTALIRAFGNASDLEGAMSVYESITNPDVIAFNALLDTCCRCRSVKRAMQLLDMNKQNRDKNLRFITPDIASYGSVISALLKIGTPAASQATQKVYKEMKYEWSISPDNVLVDA